MAYGHNHLNIVNFIVNNVFSFGISYIIIIMNSYDILNKDNSPIGMIIFIVIFFGIIAILVIVAFVGSKKDKQEKLISNDKKRKISTKAEKSRVIIFVSLNKMIKDLEKELKHFKPSIGIKSLGDINKEYSNMIKKIQHSKELKEVYDDPDYKLEIKELLDNLDKCKPSLWSKNTDIQFSFNLIREKSNVLSKKDENKEYVKEGLKKEWN